MFYQSKARLAPINELEPIKGLYARIYGRTTCVPQVVTPEAAQSRLLREFAPCCAPALVGSPLQLGFRIRLVMSRNRENAWPWNVQLRMYFIWAVSWNSLLIRKGQILWLAKGDIVDQRQFIHARFGIAA